MNKPLSTPQSKWIMLTLAAVTISLPNRALAENSQNQEQGAIEQMEQDSTDQKLPENALELKTVTVKAKRDPSKRDNEITGLGKVVKTSKTLDQEQVLGIRDLTRYDPAISVVEQGRGASSGYSIRGVDRNRVSLAVDGLPQAQSQTIQGGIGQRRPASGAINEVEYENIRAIEISKGGSSSEYGSGSLGGAVGFTTKEPGDIIKNGKNWGLDTKTAYSDKNRQWTQSVAAAAKTDNGLEFLGIYTKRKGKEIEAHRDSGSHQQEISRINARADGSYYRLDSPSCQPNCPTQQTVSGLFHPNDAIKETVGAKDYTGPDRLLPSPMITESDSYFSKIGWQIAPKHYVGGVFEHTTQIYDMQDMSIPSYYRKGEENYIENIGERLKKQGLNEFTNGIFLPNADPMSGLAIGLGDQVNTAPHSQWQAVGLNYSRSYYNTDKHVKNRKGLQYRYENPDKDSWIDRAVLAYDTQDLRLNSTINTHYCSPYPSHNRNCRASADKPWSGFATYSYQTDEKFRQLRLDLKKQFDLAFGKYDVSLALGANRQQLTFQQKDIYAEHAIPKRCRNTYEYPQHIDPNSKTYDPNACDTAVVNPTAGQTKDNPVVWKDLGTTVYPRRLCSYDNSKDLYYDCLPSTIKGSHRFVSLRNNLALGEYFDLGSNVRFDQYRFRSDDVLASTGNFSKLSWNAGMVFKPSNHLSLSYRASSGFRVPAFYEMYGQRIRMEKKSEMAKNYPYSNFVPETSLNQEVGIYLKGNMGWLEASYYQNRYKDLITLANNDEHAKKSPFSYNYFNSQNITVAGIDISGKIYWDGVMSFLPEGLYSRFGYSKIKLRNHEIKPGFSQVSTPFLDTLQPSRYIASIGYDSPSGKWGIQSIGTYSKSKNPAELLGKWHLKKVDRDFQSTSKASKSWYIWDIVGYVNLKKFLTLRAGIYNATNRRYITWESVRQTAYGANNRHSGGGNYQRYAAPGRNITLSMEMKF